MNYIKNDYGQLVVSVGAEGSLERVKIQYPKTIDRIAYLLSMNHTYRSYVDFEILDALSDGKVADGMEAQAIMDAVINIFNPPYAKSFLAKFPSWYEQRIAQEQIGL